MCAAAAASRVFSARLDRYLQAADLQFQIAHHQVLLAQRFAAGCGQSVNGLHQLRLRRDTEPVVHLAFFFGLNRMLHAVLIQRAVNTVLERRLIAANGEAAAHQTTQIANGRGAIQTSGSVPLRNNIARPPASLSSV